MRACALTDYYLLWFLCFFAFVGCICYDNLLLVFFMGKMLECTTKPKNIDLLFKIQI